MVLQEEEGARMLPIWIGEFEARAIGDALAGKKMARPMTHDLLLTTIRALGGTIKGITITSLEDHTYYAEIHVSVGGKEVLLDARSSDSIALAVRSGARIFVTEQVIEASVTPGVTVIAQELTKEEKEARLKKRLEELDPGDFGNFDI